VSGQHRGCALRSIRRDRWGGETLHSATDRKRLGDRVEAPEFLSGYDLHDPLEEKIAEVEKLLASEDGEPEYVRAKTGLVETESVSIPVQIIVGSVSLPVGQLIEESAVLGLEERHGQIGYVTLAGVFGKVVEVC
jgi:hypothetical protein